MKADITVQLDEHTDVTAEFYSTGHLTDDLHKFVIRPQRWHVDEGAKLRIIASAKGMLALAERLAEAANRQMAAEQQRRDATMRRG